MTDRAWCRMWPNLRPLVGMVHLLPLPGAPGWDGSMRRVLDRAVADAGALVEAGFDALVVENYADVPFHRGDVPAVTVAALTAAVIAVRAAVPVPVGVNVLRNDALAAIGIAAATGALFVRVNVHTGAMWTDQGLIEGRAADTLRLRAALGADIAVLADVHVKHAVPPPGSELAPVAADTWHRGLADALLVTGAGTGVAASLEHVEQVRGAVPGAPVLVASGVGAETVRETLAVADGAIIGSSVMHGGVAGAGIDPRRARALVRAARG